MPSVEIEPTTLESNTLTTTPRPRPSLSIYGQALFWMLLDHDTDNIDLPRTAEHISPNGTSITARSHACHAPVLTGHVPAYSVAPASEVTLWAVNQQHLGPRCNSSRWTDSDSPQDSWPMQRVDTLHACDQAAVDCSLVSTLGSWSDSWPPCWSIVLSSTREAVVYKRTGVNGNFTETTSYTDYSCNERCSESYFMMSYFSVCFFVASEMLIAKYIRNLMIVVTV